MVVYRLKNFLGALEINATGDTTRIFSWASDFNESEVKHSVFQPFHGVMFGDTYQSFGFLKEDPTSRYTRLLSDRLMHGIRENFRNLAEQYRRIKVQEHPGLNASAVCYVFEDGQVFLLHDNCDVYAIKAFVFTAKKDMLEKPLYIGSIENEARYLKMLERGVYLESSKA